MKDKLKNICSLFQIYGDYVSGIPFGTGHINDTYQITYNQGGTLLHYTLQRLNTNVFRRPLELMENVSRVTQHIHNKIELQRTPGTHCSWFYHIMANRTSSVRMVICGVAIYLLKKPAPMTYLKLQTWLTREPKPLVDSSRIWWIYLANVSVK